MKTELDITKIDVNAGTDKQYSNINRTMGSIKSLLSDIRKTNK